MDKVSLGIPVYGAQTATWWGPLVKQAAEFSKQNIELVKIHAIRGMMVDVNRNHIVDDFLKSDAEWLRWIDDDNVDKIGSIRRQIDCSKTLVTGLYTKRNDSGDLIAYFKDANGEYISAGGFHPGEIVPIDAAGMGGCLVHRSVFEDIIKTHTAFDVAGGGVYVAHNDDILGDVFDATVDENDGKIVDGALHIRLRQQHKHKPFPFFMLGFGRTEDYGFFEMAKRAGHQLWLDSSVTLAHIGEKEYRPEDTLRNAADAARLQFYERVIQ